MTSGTSGPMSQMRFAFYDPDESCWRTSQATFLSDSDRYSETWPKRGMTRTGSAYELPTLALPTVVPACSSLLPTPMADHSRGLPSEGTDYVAVSLLPTPMASMNGPSQREIDEGNPKARLETAVALLPTPTAQAAKHDADDRGPGTLDDYNLWSVAPRLPATPRATRGGSSTENHQALTGAPSDPPFGAGRPSWDVPLPLPLSATDEAGTA